jgi:hypothetical protein
MGLSDRSINLSIHLDFLVWYLSKGRGNLMSRGSAVGIAAGYGLRDPR